MHLSGSKGQEIWLCSNLFRTYFGYEDYGIYKYRVAITYPDERRVQDTSIRRWAVQYLQPIIEVYQFAYDGGDYLFTLSARSLENQTVTIVLDHSDMPLRRCNAGDATNEISKKITVGIYYDSKISTQDIESALQGNDTANPEDAIGVLNMILRQVAAKQNCLLVGQSFFYDEEQNFVDIGGGVIGVKGFHSSFRPTQGGLVLNFDTSTTVIVKPGPVLDFLLANQNKTEIHDLDWTKVPHVLTNLRVRVLDTTSTSNTEYTIIGLSEQLCKDDFPCIKVGNPNRPTYFPIEICELVSLQPYTKPLTDSQRAALIQQSSQTPNQKMTSLTEGLKKINYDADPVVQDFRLDIGSSFVSTRVQGRLLPVPRLKTGHGLAAEIDPSDGIWDFDYKKFVVPTTVTRWDVVNFSADCDAHRLFNDLIEHGRLKGINVEGAYEIFEEDSQAMNLSASARVERMYELVNSRLRCKPCFLLCILPERKNSDIYGAWKKKCLVEWGVATQCIVPAALDATEKYLTSVLLKINVKLGGLNSKLAMEYSPELMPEVLKIHTMIVGIAVSHGSPGQPSIAAIVNSREWPLLSRYKATVRTQSARVEMMDNLFNPNPDSGKDEGIFKELFKDFESSSHHMRPDHIIIFRDGVGESQFHQVVSTELDEMRKACQHEDKIWKPKFTVILAQKSHHTKFFGTMPGTIIDSELCHPLNNDFYLCAHNSMTGETIRPTHYHVLYDEIGFSTDDLQEFVHSLSYVYQISPTAISVAAPIRYAHLAAAQMGKIYEAMMSETGSSHAGTSTSGGAVPVPSMPPLHKDVAESMFFC